MIGLIRIALITKVPTILNMNNSNAEKTRVFSKGDKEEKQKHPTKSKLILILH